MTSAFRGVKAASDPRREGPVGRQLGLEADPRPTVCLRLQWQDRVCSFPCHSHPLTTRQGFSLGNFQERDFSSPGRKTRLRKGLEVLGPRGAEQGANGLLPQASLQPCILFALLGSKGSAHLTSESFCPAGSGACHLSPSPPPEAWPRVRAQYTWSTARNS